jgi:hypothetical protein
MRDLRGSITMDETHEHFAGEFGGKEDSRNAKEFVKREGAAMAKTSHEEQKAKADALSKKAVRATEKAKALPAGHPNKAAAESKAAEAHKAAGNKQWQVSQRYKDREAYKKSGEHAAQEKALRRG